MAGGLSDSAAAAVAKHALAYVRPGNVVGLGSGQAATAFVHALGRAVHAGLSVTGIPSSEATATLARQLGIPLGSLEDSPSIDVTLVPLQLGVTWIAEEQAYNFALYARHADAGCRG